MYCGLIPTVLKGPGRAWEHIVVDPICEASMLMPILSLPSKSKISLKMKILQPHYLRSLAFWNSPQEQFCLHLTTEDGAVVGKAAFENVPSQGHKLLPCCSAELGKVGRNRLVSLSLSSSSLLFLNRNRVK